jgi:hypothetical protein
MQIVFDLETVPSQKPGAREAVKATIKPPGTLKKPESIQSWWDTESVAAIEEACRKQSFDALHGEIVSIACQGPDGQVWARCRAQGESEADLIVEFGAVVQGWLEAAATRAPDGTVWMADDPYLIAHNAQFDLGFLWRRCVVLGVRLPWKLPRPDARAGQHFGCTMLAWSGYGGKVSLDALCGAMGIETSKDDLTGAEVFDAWLAGECTRIATYNAKDVKATALVWERLNGGAA